MKDILLNVKAGHARYEKKKEQEHEHARRRLDHKEFIPSEPRNKSIVFSPGHFFVVKILLFIVDSRIKE